jgi:hypothetical protein
MIVFETHDCPVGCGGGLKILKSAKNSQMILFCSACGCAWNSTPQNTDGIKSLEEIAPDGFMLADENDLEKWQINQYTREKLSPYDYVELVRPSK